MSLSPEQFQHLAQLPLFAKLASENLQAVAAEARLRKVEQGAFFFFQEDPADRVYLLLQGQVKLGQLTPDGQQVILNVIGPWQIFGMIAFTGHGMYPVSAEAAAECQALAWDKQTLGRLATRFPQLAINAMSEMAERVSEFQGQIRTLSTERVERRLARVILRLVRQVGRKVDEGVLIDLSISRQDLAEMSGTTLFTVSRILSQWERRGLIDAGRERVVIRQPHGIVMIAEDNPE